jgi:hypothetical protein
MILSENLKSTHARGCERGGTERERRNNKQMIHSDQDNAVTQLH